MRIKNLLALMIIILTASACHNTAPVNSNHRGLFIDKAGMDTTVKPGDDFFSYANGNWIKQTSIPPSATDWGSYYTLFDDNQKKLKAILVDLTKHFHAKDSREQKVADLFRSGMDTITIEKAGYQPILPLLKRIDNVRNYRQLVNLAAAGYAKGNGYLFAFSVDADDRDNRKNAVKFLQDGLPLPEPAYYLKNDQASRALRTKYIRYISRLFQLTGTSAALSEKQAGEILKLEKEIAFSHFTPAEKRDPLKNYHQYALSELGVLMPHIDITNLFDRLSIRTDTVLVAQPRYYRALDSLLVQIPIEVWKNKLRYKVISAAAPLLSRPFRNADFDFWEKTVKGQRLPKERWKIMAENVDTGLGDLLGQLYTEKYFTGDAKERMLELVNNLQDVFRSRIKRLTWMTEETKIRAAGKLDAFAKKIGYPDRWEDYRDVEIHPSDFFANMESIAAHDYQKSIRKINRPVDRSTWIMTPPTVNAYYSPVYNDITFPAGILQFPFFDKDADDAVNYGAIGAVIAHEMTHGFDDQGRRYDRDGNLKNWWNGADDAHFKLKMKVLIDQYNRYTILNGIPVNGTLTQGENLADLGGLSIAYEAFKHTPQGKSGDRIDGFTPDQRFFLSFARVWRIKVRDETIRLRINIDPHSPEKFRANGPLSNFTPFYRAFHVKQGDKLYRPDSLRVKIW